MGELKPGDRVKHSEKWLEGKSVLGRARAATKRGTVTTVSKLKPEYVYVLIDCRKTPTQWHSDFWGRADGKDHA